MYTGVRGYMPPVSLRKNMGYEGVPPNPFYPDIPTSDTDNVARQFISDTFKHFVYGSPPRADHCRGPWRQAKGHLETTILTGATTPERPRLLPTATPTPLFGHAPSIPSPQHCFCLFSFQRFFPIIAPHCQNQNYTILTQLRVTAGRYN